MYTLYIYKYIVLIIVILICLYTTYVVCLRTFLYCFVVLKEKMLKDRATMKSLNRGWARIALKAKVVYNLDFF